MNSCQTLRIATAIGLVCTLSRIAAAADAPPPMPAAGPPPAGEYHLEKSHASITLRVNHMGFSTYTTRFGRFDANLTFDPAHIEASKLTATIETDSLEMPGAPQMCLDITKGPQLLDVAHFPQITFKSDSVRMTGANAMEITGTMTLRGVSHALVLAATFNGGYPGMPKMDPHARIGFSAHGSLKRSDFGMGFGIPAPGTSMGVGDLVDFAIETEFSGPALSDPGAVSQ